MPGQTLTVFNTISLDGYFTDAKNDMSWAHAGTDDAEWQEFVQGNSGGGGTLVFGRVTYQMMAGFWPTPMATQSMPKVAEDMNNHEKIVFSKTLGTADWQNTTLVKGNLVDEMRRLKSESGKGMVILGSGQIVAQLAEAGLIDAYQMVVKPIVLGSGRTLFEAMTRQLPLKRVSSRAFGNGNVVLGYEPA